MEVEKKRLVGKTPHNRKHQQGEGSAILTANLRGSDLLDLSGLACRQGQGCR